MCVSVGVALLASFAGLFATCKGALADTIYLSAVTPDSAAPFSSSPLFLNKAVVSSTRHWYTNSPPLRFVFGGSL